MCISNSTGAIVVRNKCRAKESVLSASAIASIAPTVQGQQGPKGDKGVQGPPGISSFGRVEHVIDITSLTAGGITGDAAVCPAGKVALGGGCNYGGLSIYASYPFTADSSIGSFLGGAGFLCQGLNPNTFTLYSLSLHTYATCAAVSN